MLSSILIYGMDFVGATKQASVWWVEASLQPTIYQINVIIY